MTDAFSLLNINRDVLKDFHLLANRVDNLQIERVINQNLRKLKSIEERLLVDEGIKVSKQSIDEILYKVVQASRKLDFNMDNWTMRELRIVSYYMMKLQDDENAYEYALMILDNGWRNMFFNGLVFYLMNSWCLIKPELRKSTSRLVVKKLQQYQENNRRYLMLKNHANLFEEMGPQRLALLLASQNKDVREAPLVLGSKGVAFSQSYFSDVIVKYCDRKTIDLDTLEEIFEAHNVARTKKLVFAEMVKRADANGDPLMQTQLSKFINRQLGDVTLASTWAPFAGATQEEALKLKRAMQLVNLWFTRRIIETFFEVCVQDRDRKKFWLDYVPYVSGFKIVGSTMTKRTLQNDQRVSTMFQRHFIETNSTYSQTAALVLSIKDYVLVEFSDTGSLYAYKQGNKKVQFLRRGVRFMNSTNDLKDTSLDILIEKSQWDKYTYYCKEEGRLAHMGYWQNRLKLWMQRMVMSSDNTAMSFFDTKDDDTFKAQPLPKQDKIRKPVEPVTKPKVETPLPQPQQPKAQPQQPKAQPQQPKAQPQQPKAQSQQPKAQPQQPKTQPQQPKAQPQQPKAQSQQPKVQPQQPKVQPQQSKPQSQTPPRSQLQTPTKPQLQAQPRPQSQQPKPQLQTPQSQQSSSDGSHTCLQLQSKPLLSRVYDINVSYKFSSKWVFNDLCRVVCNERGFYVNISTTKKFILVREIVKGTPSGNIWIKRPNLQGWSKIIFATTGGDQLIIGFIKNNNYGLVFRQDFKYSPAMIIKIK